jgi:hypothetical protein
MAIFWAGPPVMRVSSDDEGDGNSDEGGGRATAMRTMGAGMTVVGKDEGGGIGDEGGGQQRG